MNYCYFKYFNEVNKLNNYIKEENSFTNYDDLILNLICEKEDLNLAKIVFPLVEDKSLVIKFLDGFGYFEFDFYYHDDLKESEWTKLIFDNGFSKINEIYDENYFYKLLFFSSRYGLMEIIKMATKECLIKKYQNEFSGEDLLIEAILNGHLEVVRYLVENGVDIHIHDDSVLTSASENGHQEVVDFLEARSAF